MEPPLERTPSSAVIIFVDRLDRESTRKSSVTVLSASPYTTVLEVNKRLPYLGPAHSLLARYSSKKYSLPSGWAEGGTQTVVR
jgi:hypothetical protein